MNRILTTGGLLFMLMSVAAGCDLYLGDEDESPSVGAPDGNNWADATYNPWVADSGNYWPDAGVVPDAAPASPPDAASVPDAATVHDAQPSE